MAVRRRAGVRSPKRSRPLSTYTLSPEARELLAVMAEEQGLSRSAVLEVLIRREARRRERAN